MDNIFDAFLDRNQYSYNKPATPQSAQITNNQITELATFMRTIMNDMCGSEQGKQWLLTCYGPTKGKPNFPNFTDTSFEEVRWSIYEAKEDTEKLYKVVSLTILPKYFLKAKY